ncbi:hypothetical protein ER308_01285 [Egibacter rhizosphaerae]|uniref:Peptide chain release factor 1 n=1 Tax=Egibacter rhizosphaerae TaxID=1670831 RepID=A0A411YAY2_9ACTN|nr:hypothetical protein [Egibacter rhizosphaerae]QBI18337.1 hypothetical protein ER308_01285 [Egibacter rhizosphaerae]
MRLTHDDVRSLAGYEGQGAPVTSVYVDVDGERYPRVEDALARLESLFDAAERAADRQGHAPDDTVQRDRQAVSEWLRAMERTETAGVALFVSRGEIIAELRTAVPLRNRVRVGGEPFVLPLQVLLDRAHHVALVLVQRDEAEIYRYHLGRTWRHEEREADEVPGYRTHQGNSDLRAQKHDQHWVQRHYDETAERLRLLHAQAPLDAVVVAGPHEEAQQLRQHLAGEVDHLVRGEPVNLPVEAGAHEAGQVLEDVEHELARERRSALLDRLEASAGQPESAAFGLRHTIDAFNAGQVETLLAAETAMAPGYRADTGALAVEPGEARAYGDSEPTPVDLVDELLELAYASSSHVELVGDPEALGGHPVAALLRY